MFRHLSIRLLANSCLRRPPKFNSNVKQLRLPLTSGYDEFIQVRNKHVTSGVQGRRNSKTPPKKYDEDDEVNILENDVTPEDKVSLKDRYGIYH